jgi:anti-sigma factor RsiW
MITCQHARHLFDSYLDGELSANLQTELHAHRLNCTACQNELALLEACGDVIAMDRREPQVSVSFTDRVLLAQRGRQSPRRRRWGRTFWLVGSPMAAAASVVFTLFVVAPQNRLTPKTVTLGEKVAMPEIVQDQMLANTRRTPSEAELKDLANTPKMSMEEFEGGLAQFVKGSTRVLERTQRGYQQFGLLWQMGLSSTHEKLAAAQMAQEKAASAVQERPKSELDPLDPSCLSQPPSAPDSAKESELAGPVEAL